MMPTITVTLLKLQLLQVWRSNHAGRSVAIRLAVIVAAAGVLVLLWFMGTVLPMALQQITGRQQVTGVLNALIIFFFLLEVMYRYFLQKLTVIQLQHYLHLPISRPTIIRFLLLRSFISPYNLVAALLFSYFAYTQIAPAYGFIPASAWLLHIVFISWTLHWAMLYYKHRFGDSFWGFLALVGAFGVAAAALYYELFDVQTTLQPFFAAPVHKPLTVLGSATGCALGGWGLYRFYKAHAYLEELITERKRREDGSWMQLFSRFGAAGRMADLELKLILRHKRPRSYLIFSFMFLLYGFLFYRNGVMDSSSDLFGYSLFIAIFVTGSFMIYYAQLFISWNSGYFDFHLSQPNGLTDLIYGKYLLLTTACGLLYLLSLLYAFIYPPALLNHTMAFLFNIGCSAHAVIAIALWRPEPIDLNDSAFFNYQGIGIEQLLIALPTLGLPYVVYVPLQYLFNQTTAFIALGVMGAAGVVLHKSLIGYHLKRIRSNRHAMGTNFRSNA